MNANAKKWVEALRSGEYEQARETLRDANGAYCCLGVACELYRQEFGGWWNGHEFDVSKDEIAEDGELSDTVRDWLGLAEKNGAFNDGLDSLILKNDGGSSFAEIASIIESDPAGLFR